MRLSRHTISIALGLALSASMSHRAYAGDPAAAQALFDAGMALMKDGKFTEACPKLEESQKLDPGAGTQFRLAECYEKVGRIASAWALFFDVAEASKRDKNTRREKQARERADALKARVPKITLHASRATLDLAGLELFKDGEPIGKSLIDLAVPIDPGERVLSAKAPGKLAWERKITVAEGASMEVTIPPLEDAPPPPKPKPADGAQPIAPANEGPSGAVIGMRVGAGVAAAAGIAGIIVGSVFGLRAKSEWDEALTHCGGLTDHCSSEGIDLGGKASTSAAIATTGFVVGGVLIAGGAVLLGLSYAQKPAAKKSAFIMAPSLAPRSAGVVMMGSF